MGGVEIQQFKVVLHTGWHDWGIIAHMLQSFVVSEKA